MVITTLTKGRKLPPTWLNITPMGAVPANLGLFPIPAAITIISTGEQASKLFHPRTADNLLIISAMRHHYASKQHQWDVSICLQVFLFFCFFFVGSCMIVFLLNSRYHAIRPFK